jgi:hypothetical protein
MVWDGKPGNEKNIPVGTRLEESPNAAGFGYFYGFTHARNIETIIEQDRVVENVKDVENQPRMISKAVEWIGTRKGDKPFFLYFPMCPPHDPVIPSPEFVGKSGATDAVKKDPGYGDWLIRAITCSGICLMRWKRAAWPKTRSSSSAPTTARRTDPTRRCGPRKPASTRVVTVCFSSPAGPAGSSPARCPTRRFA